MDAVTTAIVAAVLSGAHTTGPEENNADTDAAPEINASYRALKEALIERFEGAPTLMQAIRQLESIDNPRNRQMLHQEVKMVRADQARKVVLAADELINEIQKQPRGDDLLLQARTWEKFS